MVNSSLVQLQMIRALPTHKKMKKKKIIAMAHSQRAQENTSKGRMHNSNMPSTINNLLKIKLVILNC